MESNEFSSLMETLAEKGIIAKNHAVMQAYIKARLLAGSKSSILITGESGVGKSRLAAFIQEDGPWKNAPFIRIHCNAVPAELFASELFGYTANAFTGASAMGKQGLLDAANEGTVLFDEINELPMQSQIVLLQFLQNRQITPIGALRSKTIRTRIICTAGVDLTDMVRRNTFRLDLFYRISVANIDLPPLRERREDIPLLLDYFMSTFQMQYQLEKKQLTPEAVAYLCQLPWRGNIREVQNLVQQLCLFAPDAFITKEYLLQIMQGVEPAPVESALGAARKTLKEAVSEFEGRYIQDTLEHTPDLRTAAAQLGISFSTLCRKKRELGLH